MPKFKHDYYRPQQRTIRRLCEEIRRTWDDARLAKDDLREPYTVPEVAVRGVRVETSDEGE